MADQITYPILMTKVQRRYGRCDFERFDNIASSHMRAGRGKIGKVDVDCKFLFTKSQWGVLGGHPGGIIYLDLDFLEPADCRLQSATVLVTLEEDGRQTNEPGADEPACPVKFTDHYGPKSLRGPEKVMRTRRVKKLTPSIQVLGNGAGGLGVNIERTVEKTSRWNLTSHIKSSEGHIWYNQLRWELKENSLEDESMRNNVIHTAFALEHNAKKFYMTVSISGKLAHRSERFKERLKKFGSSLGKDDETVTTVIEWKNGYSCPKRLDRIAQGLRFAMEVQNLSNTPMEMPNAFPAAFAAAPTTHGPEAPLGRLEVTEPEILPGLDDETWPPDSISAITPGPLQASSRPPRPPEPTMENMSLAAGLGTPLLELPGRMAFARSESRWSNSTLVENGAESSSGRSTVRRRRKGFEGELGEAQIDIQRDGSRRRRADVFGFLMLLTWLTDLGLLCVTVLADALGLPLETFRRSPPSIGRELSRQPEEQVKALDEASDVQDASDVETVVSPTSSPAMRREAFQRALEDGLEDPRRRAYLVRGVGNPYLCPDTGEQLGLC
ncbi:hypothetical protein QBC47DRAFT_376805 [Echria macrotheca]|uniref:Uncharacterized protein n=1 Tax=Echria macrotheca TaxID=438768 RepID=A0AAJ0BGB5_9PEZI|nr:hypothetical protein QBC47DRAFT_376805 [Echria macrotheca]